MIPALHKTNKNQDNRLFLNLTKLRIQNEGLNYVLEINVYMKGRAG
jgi:hypothetical protein